MGDLHTYYEDDHLRIQVADLAEGGTGRTLVSFTGVGHRLGGMDVQEPEFFRAGQGYDKVIFVSDLTRSWGNALDLPRLTAAVQDIAGDQQVDCIGNSMGGFLALLAPTFLPVRTTLAFAPQFSVHPDVVPWEPRWLPYRAQITDWRYPSLEGQFRPDSRYYVFMGGDKHDMRHAEMFPQLPNLTMTVMPMFDHKVARDLKTLGLLPGIVQHSFAGSFTLDLLEQMVNAAIQKLTAGQALPPGSQTQGDATADRPTT